jgi:hypothetical protein
MLNWINRVRETLALMAFMLIAHPRFRAELVAAFEALRDKEATKIEDLMGRL